MYTTNRERNKSIPEQIVEQMLAILASDDLYDEAVLSKLKDLTSKGDLTSAKSIIDAISVLKAETP